MKKVIAYLRMEEWLSSKVTMMLGILMYFLYLSNSSTKKSLIDVLIYFLFLGMFLAISYVANDFSDLEIDKKVGKSENSTCFFLRDVVLYSGIWKKCVCASSSVG